MKMIFYHLDEVRCVSEISIEHATGSESVSEALYFLQLRNVHRERVLLSRIQLSFSMARRQVHGPDAHSLDDQPLIGYAVPS